MNITLTPELEQFVNEKVKSGRFRSAIEVVREGLVLLREEDELARKHEELRRTIAVGIEELDRGQGVPLDDAEVARIKAEGRRLRQATKANNHEPNDS